MGLFDKALELKVKELEDKQKTLLDIIQFYQDKTRYYESVLRENGIKADFDL